MRIREEVKLDSSDREAIRRSAIREIFTTYSDGGVWVRRNFNLKQHLGELHGPFIEVGGPTPGGYTLVDTADLCRPLLTTNAFPAEKQKGQISLPTEEVRRQIKLLADATSLPFADGSLGLVLMAHLPSPSQMIAESVFLGAIIEASRVLEPGGLLVVETGLLPGFLFALLQGFIPAMTTMYPCWHSVLEW